MQGARRQKSQADDCVRVLLECTDPRLSAGLQYPTQMQRFLDAALSHCAIYPNNIAFVLKRLGDAQTAGLQRLREISRFSKTIRVDAGGAVSPSVLLICALLNLVTLPALMNSVLKQFYNPVLTTVADNLDMQAMCEAVEKLDAQYTKSTPQGAPSWQPENWVQLLQPIVTFMAQCLQTVGCNTEIELRDMQQNITRLKRAAEAFQQQGMVASKQAKHAKMMETALHKQRVHARTQSVSNKSKAYSEQAGPGAMRPDGARHDNDHINIQDISIAPTQQEVLSQVAPYLPPNQPGTVMHLEQGSQEAHKDLHFRMVRHDLIGELCDSALRFHQAGGVSAALPKRVTSGRANLRKGNEDLSLYVYGNLTINNLITTKFGPGVQYEVAFDDLPCNSNKTRSQKHEYWDRSRRLQHGTLVALWWETPVTDTGSADTNQTAREPCITFAVISVRDPDQLAPKGEPMQRPSIGIRLCQGCGSRDDILRASLGGELPGKAIMLQASGSFFAYEPILKALQSNHSMPLAHYIAAPSLPKRNPEAGSSLPERTPGASLLSKLGSKLFGANPDEHEAPSLPPSGMLIPPAAYQLEAPSFKLDLSCLTPDAKAAAGAIAIDSQASEWPLAALCQATTLDDSQLKALQAALSRELALIQGPPGTGKTYVGIQIVKALLANTRGHSDSATEEVIELVEDIPAQAGNTLYRGLPCIGPVLIICFTNHALDQFLEGLVAAGLTSLVRVGGREPTWLDVKDHIKETAPNIHDSLLSQKRLTDGEFQQVGNSERNFWWNWLHGQQRNQAQQKAAEAAFARAQAAVEVSGMNSFGVLATASDEETDEAPNKPMDMEPADLEAENEDSHVPETLRMMQLVDRDLEDLLLADDAWMMTWSERHKLYNHWKAELQTMWLTDLKQAMSEYESVREEQRRVQADVDLNVLKQARLVGMTTAGVASKQDLVAAMAPKAHGWKAADQSVLQVVVVEEAGEVFEAHILASLAPTTEHLILIGDPEQLRPKPQLYTLQIESGRGYDLDRSLFERLVKDGFPMVTLELQRRMRPSISRLIRNTIYPSLQDHASVTNYPRVQGMVHDVFFWSHDHPEGGKDENASKQNGIEAAMAARLAFYLVQQGYDGGDITILTPYVGQLLLLRTEIRKYMRFVVSDKDAEQLAALQGDEDQDDAQSSSNASTVPPSSGQQAGAVPPPTSGISQVSLKDSVRVATVDNFQGEESTIVILSLVRNNKDGSIGFLKTSNRVNVMLSRAKHGMYILGHAETLTANKNSNMWHEVLGMLEEDNAVGESLPVVCANHRNQVTQISAARDFDTFVRDGGCSLQCTARMPCGHTCPRMCHPDDPRHLALECMKPCTHELQPCGHPCQKLCYERCGPCTQPISQTLLPCGHTAHNLPCCKTQAPDEVICSESVTVKLSQCNHTIGVKCGEVAAVKADATRCTATCNAELGCGHACQHRCGACLQAVIKHNTAEGSKHLQCRQTCSRALLCGHECGQACHGGSTCPPCKRACTAQCVHGHCRGLCTNPCGPCAEPCIWHCQHQGPYMLPCGAPCNRLPCDQRCSKRLSCGHRCPCVCGEPCPDRRFCATCGDRSVLVYDIYEDMQKPLREYDGAALLTDPLVTLTCGHVFPMSSMDGFIDLDAAYAKDSSGRWTKLRPVTAEVIASPCLMCITAYCPKCRLHPPLHFLHPVLHHTKQNVCRPGLQHFLPLQLLQTVRCPFAYALSV
ncbi:hypothetical protein ABBQ32_013348 [Trebouxia sp. C0010 RCD-2024]